MADIETRFDKLLDALVMMLKQMGQGPPNPGLGEDELTRAMVRALEQGKRFIRPRTFGGN